MAAHANRQKQLIERLKVSEVHHLYSLSGIEDFLSGDSKGLRPPWDFWNVPRPILAEQFDNILTWLHEYENFEVRLRTTALPETWLLLDTTSFWRNSLGLGQLRLQIPFRVSRLSGRQQQCNLPDNFVAFGLTHRQSRINKRFVSNSQG